MLDVAPDGARQHDLLQVATEPHQIMHLMAVIHTQHILFDDGPRIKGFGNVVRKVK